MVIILVDNRRFIKSLKLSEILRHDDSNYFKRMSPIIRNLLSPPAFLRVEEIIMSKTKILFLISTLLFQGAFAQDARIIKLPELNRLLADSSTQIHVVNFWATWCGPCVKELPYFERLNADAGPELKVTLVSLDLDLDPNPGKVFKFVKSKGLKSDIVLLDEANPDTWIDQVDNRWSGALPFTLIINHRTGKRMAVDKSLEEGQLEKYLSEIR